jgi:hypothetical protein
LNISGTHPERTATGRLQGAGLRQAVECDAQCRLPPNSRDPARVTRTAIP